MFRLKNLPTENAKACLPPAGGTKNTEKKQIDKMRLCDLRVFLFVISVVKPLTA
jgi:hypothetical protein